MTKQLSKFLSKVLRHKPSMIDLTLDESGWANVDELLEKLDGEFNLDLLKEIVETNDKKRFEFSENMLRIRACQGHSVNVNLGYEEKTPPVILFHGTAMRFMTDSRREGLKKMKRHHVHLSREPGVAAVVGSRHQKEGVRVLEINAQKMHENGFKFYQSTNGVWLTDHVPTEYINGSCN